MSFLKKIILLPFLLSTFGYASVEILSIDYNHKTSEVCAQIEYTGTDDWAFKIIKKRNADGLLVGEIIRDEGENGSWKSSKKKPEKWEIKKEKKLAQLNIRETNKQKRLEAEESKVLTVDVCLALENIGHPIYFDVRNAGLLEVIGFNDFGADSSESSSEASEDEQIANLLQNL